MIGYFEAAGWRFEERRSGELDTQMRRWLALRSSGWICSGRSGLCMWPCYFHRRLPSNRT